jgi:hypothetical protein
MKQAVFVTEGNWLTVIANKSVKMLAFITAALKVNGKTCITNWYVI